MRFSSGGRTLCEQLDGIAGPNAARRLHSCIDPEIAAGLAHQCAHDAGILRQIIEAVGHHHAARTLDSHLEHGLAEALSALGFVHFFPEGECYRWNQAVRPFRPGAFLLALRLQVPVVPLAIVLHEQRVLGRRSIRLLGRMVRVPPRVVVVIGSPIRPEPDGREACGEACRGACREASRGDAGRSPGLRRKAEALAEAARAQVQCAIDERGGSRSLYRGPMPRLTRSAEANHAVNAAIPTGR